MPGTIASRCDRAGHKGLHLAVGALLLLIGVTPARAEWTAAAYLGSSFTRPATLTLAQPAGSTRISQVHFDAKPFASPPYYGYRAGWRATRRLGAEAELIHLKVFAHRADLPQTVERFSISHGLNLLLANIVWRTRPDGRVDLELRAGGGIAIPHGESEISGVTREQYEVSSLALQAAVGPVVRLADHLAAFAEYKLTTAAPSVSVAGGHINGRYTSQHALFGLRWNVGRGPR